MNSAKNSLLKLFSKQVIRQSIVCYISSYSLDKSRSDNINTIKTNERICWKERKLPDIFWSDTLVFDVLGSKSTRTQKHAHAKTRAGKNTRVHENTPSHDAKFRAWLVWAVFPSEFRANSEANSEFRANSGRTPSKFQANSEQASKPLIFLSFCATNLLG